MSELILLINHLFLKLLSHLFDDKPFVSTVLIYDSLLINIYICMYIYIYIHSITLEQDEAKVSCYLGDMLSSLPSCFY